MEVMRPAVALDQVRLIRGLNATTDGALRPSSGGCPVQVADTSTLWTASNGEGGFEPGVTQAVALFDNDSKIAFLDEEYGGALVRVFSYPAFTPLFERDIASLGIPNYDFARANMTVNNDGLLQMYVKTTDDTFRGRLLRLDLFTGLWSTHFSFDDVAASMPYEVLNVRGADGPSWNPYDGFFYELVTFHTYGFFSPFRYSTYVYRWNEDSIGWLDSGDALPTQWAFIDDIDPVSNVSTISESFAFTSDGHIWGTYGRAVGEAFRIHVNDPSTVDYPNEPSPAPTDGSPVPRSNDSVYWTQGAPGELGEDSIHLAKNVLADMSVVDSECSMFGGPEGTVGTARLNTSSTGTTVFIYPTLFGEGTKIYVTSGVEDRGDALVIDSRSFMWTYSDG